MNRVRRCFHILVITLSGVLVSATTPVANDGPRDAALAVFKSMKRQDWAALYPIMAFSEKGTDPLLGTTAQSFDALIGKPAAEAGK